MDTCTICINLKKDIVNSIPVYNLVSSLLPMHKTQVAELIGLDENYENIDEFLNNSSFGCY